MKKFKPYKVKCTDDVYDSDYADYYTIGNIYTVLKYDSDDNTYLVEIDDDYSIWLLEDELSIFEKYNFKRNYPKELD